MTSPIEMIPKRRTHLVWYVTINDGLKIVGTTILIKVTKSVARTILVIKPRCLSKIGKKDRSPCFSPYEVCSPVMVP